MAPAHNTTDRARTVRLRCSAPEPAVKATPVTAPRWPVSTRDTIADVTSVQRPGRQRAGSMVFWVPFLASLGQGKPTQEPHWMQAPRPARGTVLISSGGVSVAMPSAFGAARQHTAAGIARHRRHRIVPRARPERAALPLSPATPISHSARSYQGARSS